MILFTRKYIPNPLRPICFHGKELKLNDQVKYLGIIVNPKLSWKLHVEAKCDKALVSLYKLRRSVSKKWGIRPRIAWWMYTAIIRPTVTNVAVVLWPRVEQKIASGKLEHIQ